MPKKEAPKPEQGMTRGEAEALAWRIADQLENIRGGEFVTDFLLLLRWHSYKATQTDAENL